MPGTLLDIEDIGVKKKQMKFLLMKLAFHWRRDEGQRKKKE